MAKRKPTTTQKLRKLVQQQVRRMEGRGYRIDAEIKQKIKTGKYQTLKSLQRDKYKKLYEKSTSEIEGKVVRGTEKRTQERRESARRAAQTRQQAKRPLASEDELEVRWEDERRKQDERDRARAEMFQEGQIVYEQVMSLIDQYPTPGSKYLKNLLLSEIAKYGRTGVLMGMAQAPSYYIDSAKVIVYYEEDADAIHSALHDFASMITGTVTSADEAKEMGDTMDEMTNMGAS